MRPEIITVHNIRKAIEATGILPYANALVQEMGGAYFFVDAEDHNFPEKPNLDGWDGASRVSFSVPGGDGKAERRHIYKRYQIHRIPLSLAAFIVETLRLKAQFSRLGVGDIDHPVEQKVYLLPGKTVFGHEVTQLTEIPAEMGPVVVEKL